MSQRTSCPHGFALHAGIPATQVCPFCDPETVADTCRQSTEAELSDETKTLPTLPGYAIEAEIGRGGMGVVYRARDLKLQRSVALKTMLAMGHAGVAERQRFRIEVEAAARLQHPNVVQLFEVGEHKELLYCALELVEGGTLARALRERPYAPTAAARLVESLARAMHYAHSRNIVHRDLKPGNVLLSAEGDPKITDFGIAKKLDDDAGQTRTGAIMGTPHYMSPEQALGETKSVGPAADIYALGAILYECLTGRPPFQGGSALEILDRVRFEAPTLPRSLKSAIPRDLETICLKCLRKDPEARYASALELADDLRRFLAREPVLARPIGKWERSLKWIRRNPVATLLLLVLLTGVAGIAWKWLEADAQRQQAERQRDLAQKNLQLAIQSNVAVGELAERLRPLAGTKAHVVEEILKVTADNYDRMLAQADDPPVVLFEGKARMLNAFSDLYFDLNRSGEALRCAREAIELWNRVLRAKPGDAAYRSGLAIAQRRLGRALMIRGDSAGSVSARRAAISHYRELISESPDDPALRAELAAALDELRESHYWRDEETEREDARRESFDLWSALSQRVDVRPEWKLGFAKALYMQGRWHYWRWEYPAALASFDTATKILNELVAAHADKSAYRLILGEVYQASGEAHVYLSEERQAREAFELALTQFDKLVHEDGGNIEWRRRQASARRAVNDLVPVEKGISREEYLKLVTDREQPLRDELTFLMQLLQGDRDNCLIQGRAQSVRSDIGLLYAARALLGDRPGEHFRTALREYRELLVAEEELANRDHEVPAWSKGPALTRQDIAAILWGQGSIIEAMREGLLAARLTQVWQEHRAQARPEDAKASFELAKAEQDLALMHIQLVLEKMDVAENLNQAAAWLTRCHARLRALLEREPHQRDWLEYLSGSLGLLTSVRYEQGDNAAVAELRAERQRLLKQLNQLPPPAIVNAPATTIVDRSSSLALNIRNLVRGQTIIEPGRIAWRNQLKVFRMKPTDSNALLVASNGVQLAGELELSPSPLAHAEALQIVDEALKALETTKKEEAPGRADLLRDLQKIKSRLEKAKWAGSGK